MAQGASQGHKLIPRRPLDGAGRSDAHFPLTTAAAKQVPGIKTWGPTNPPITEALTWDWGENVAIDSSAEDSELFL